MKKIVLTLIITLVSITMTNAQTPAATPSTPATQTEAATQGDSTIEVTSGDKTVTIAVSDLKRLAKEHLHLDDTVLTSDDAVDAVDEAVYADSAAEREQFNDLAVRGMNLAEMIVKSIAFAVIVVVFFSLLFYFLHRRRKYRTIDRAIASGYPLPPEFFGKRSVSAPKQPTTVYITQVMPAENGTAQAGTAPAQDQRANIMNSVTDWRPFKKGVMLTIIGFCLMLFFWIVGAGPVAALMLILVFFGLSKIFFAYQEQQNVNKYWQGQQWTQQQPQQQPQPAPGQPAEPQASAAPAEPQAPAAPETPPPFSPQQPSEQ